MNKLIIKTLSFIIPLFALVVTVELVLEKCPTYFQKRAEYFFNNQDKIEVLIFGSSHNQNAINQEFISVNTSNLAFGGQDLKIDYLLLSKYLSQLPRLKTVILELSYHSLEQKTPPWSDRNPLYLRYYGINNYERANRLIDYSIFMINPSLCTKLLFSINQPSTINKFGFETELSNFDPQLQHFKSLNYDTSLINNDTSNSFITRHKYENLNTYFENKAIFLKMIGLCNRFGVKPIVIVPPVYLNYYKTMKPNKKKRRDDLLQFIKTSNPKTEIFNFENTGIFSVKDFANEDHLNPQGAKKFSLIIDGILKSYTKKK